MSQKQEVKKLAIELNAIAEWMRDNSVQGNDLVTARRLSRAAQHLDFHSGIICCAGVVCDGGDDCTSDHK